MTTSTHKLPNSVLILFSGRHSKTIEKNTRFVSELNAKFKGEIYLELERFTNIGIMIDNKSVEAFLVSNKRNLTDFRAVYIKSYQDFIEQASAVVSALDASKTRFIASELRHYIPVNKLSQLAKLAAGGVRVSRTIFLPMNLYSENYEGLVKNLEVPFIFKAIDGSRGRDNYLVENKEQLGKIIDDNSDRLFLAQKYIPNDSDLRFIVIDQEIKLILQRKRLDKHTHLNNTSRGASAELIDLKTIDPKLKALAIKAAGKIGRDVSGVDIIIDGQSSQAYVLEVNADPQIASGAFGNEKATIYAEYFKKLADI